MSPSTNLPTFNSPDGRMLLKEDGTGDYVRRTDHEAVVADLRKEIADLNLEWAAVRTTAARTYESATEANPPAATD